MDGLSVEKVSFGFVPDEYSPFNVTACMECNQTSMSTFAAYVVDHSLTYRIVATLLHSLILVGGVFGNVVLILVAKKTRSLQTPTYCYLVSLAYADLIVLFSAVPEALMFHHIGIRWVLGQAGCSLLVFSNFLGINAGSLSILAFTVERYVAVMQPLLAQRHCTVGRAQKIILLVWLCSVVYCAPWLGLTLVVTDPNYPTIQLCDFRLTHEQYSVFFVADLVIFYLIPLLFAAVVYILIATVVSKHKPGEQLSRQSTVIVQRGEGSSRSASTTVVHSPLQRKSSPKNDRSSSSRYESTIKRRNSPAMQVLPMLVVVVILFAVCWLPFRGLLVYNSLVRVPWLDLWYLFFAKTLIYVNSAINPFLYNVMSKGFRDAVYRFLHLKQRKNSFSS